MSKILKKQVQNKISNYFIKLSNHLSKPESRCVREMVTGILKNGTVLVNQIASGINDSIALSKTTKRFRTHYNKKNFYSKLFSGHLESVKGKVYNGDYILVDGSDIQKKYSKMKEGLDWVKDGDKATTGLGYWLMNIVHFSKGGELMPLYNKLYSFDCGAKSENNEIKNAVKMIESHFSKKLTYIFDRGMDREILREFICKHCGHFILRLKKSTQFILNGKELTVDRIAQKVAKQKKMSVVKISKNKKSIRTFNCGAVKVQYKNGKELLDLWIVITKRENGGYCYLLTNYKTDNIDDLIKETFTAYGFRWKIEEYHRHIKTCYNLEDIQIKTFEGLESMLAILTIAMSIIYRELSSIHTRLLLESGIKTMNKNKLHELYNFIYYKLSNIIKHLLADMKPKAFLPIQEIPVCQQQLTLEFQE